MGSSRFVAELVTYFNNLYYEFGEMEVDKNIYIIRVLVLSFVKKFTINLNAFIFRE
jgi:hypothetical protein